MEGRCHQIRQTGRCGRTGKAKQKHALAAQFLVAGNVACRVGQTIHRFPVRTVRGGTLTHPFLFGLFRFVVRRDTGGLGISDLLVLAIFADASHNHCRLLQSDEIQASGLGKARL